MVVWGLYYSMSDNLNLTFDTRDEFDRRSLAEKVIKLLASDVDATPMLLDGNWGTGKTEFVIKLKNLINSQHKGMLCAYINAFQADHGDEPLLMMIGHLSGLIEKEPESKEIVKELANATLPIARIALQNIASAVLNFDIGKMSNDVCKSLEEANKDTLNSAILQSIEDYKESEKNVHVLKGVLEKLSKDKKIILIIDELDRCRPDYSLSLIERIKHIFDVKNVKFVLVANKEQLKASIRHRYGECRESELYMDKFIKYYLHIPDVNVENIVPNASIIYCQERIEKQGDSLLGVFSDGYALNLIHFLIIKNSLSLRDVEKIFRIIEIYINISDGMSEDEFGEPYIKAWVIICVYSYCFDHELFKQIKYGSVINANLSTFFHHDECKEDIKIALFRNVNISYLEEVRGFFLLVASIIKGKQEYLSDDKNFIKTMAKKFDWTRPKELEFVLINNRLINVCSEIQLLL